MSYDSYRIPSNYSDAGKIFGLFEARNTIETVLFVLPVLFACICLLPFSLTPRIIVTLVIIVPLGGFFLVGINDDSLTRWITRWWIWRQRRRLIFFRGESGK